MVGEQFISAKSLVRQRFTDEAPTLRTFHSAMLADGTGFDGTNLKHIWPFLRSGGMCPSSQPKSADNQQVETVMTRFSFAFAAAVMGLVAASPALSTDYSSSSGASVGVVTSSPDGMSLYVFDKDSSSISNCYDDCAAEWPPMLASRQARPHDGFGIIVRQDGTLQWTLGARPLYYFDDDKQPGDVNGDGYSPDWHLAKSGP